MGESKNEEIIDLNDNGDAAGQCRGVWHLRLVASRAGVPAMPAAAGNVFQSLPDRQHM
jgi:hypothetical protein